MDLVKDIPPGTEDEINVIIEIPAGKRNKYEYDKDLKVFMLDRVVPEPLVYPADYGFIPQTHCEDGDPLDVLLLIRESTYPGILVKSRPIGMFIMDDEGEEDNKLICVPVDDKYYEDVKELKDLPAHLQKEIKYFMEHYKDMKGSKVVVSKFLDSKAAKAEFEKSIKMYKEL